MTKARNVAAGTTRPSLYEEVARFSHAYFGTDAPQHIGRLIEIHTHKSAEQLSKEELMSLLDWIRSAAAFLEDDKEKVESYIADLLKLATTGGQRNYDQPEGNELTFAGG